MDDGIVPAGVEEFVGLVVPLAVPQNLLNIGGRNNLFQFEGLSIPEIDGQIDCSGSEQGGVLDIHHFCGQNGSSMSLDIAEEFWISVTVDLKLEGSAW